MRIKIAISGAHGTGKSTLATAVCEALLLSGHKVLHAPELARAICDESDDPHFFRRGSNSALKQLLLIACQAIAEGQDLENSQILVCDRTIADHWSYTATLFRKELEDSGIYSITNSYIKKHLKTYDLVFYLPPEFGSADDGVREADLEFQREIADKIKAVLNDAQVDVIEIKGELDVRTKEVIHRINQYLQSK